jgi:hypothetical protein
MSNLFPKPPDFNAGCAVVFRDPAQLNRQSV